MMSEAIHRLITPSTLIAACTEIALREGTLTKEGEMRAYMDDTSAVCYCMNWRLHQIRAPNTPQSILDAAMNEAYEQHLQKQEGLNS
jgi:hypothetical protein